MAAISDIRHQLWVLGLIRATEAIAWTSIFPYAYFMIQSFKVSENDIAFYVGCLIAVYTLGEFLTAVTWARVSDRIGRKPTLVLGSFCGLVTALSLGLSRSVAVAIVSRAFGGLCNPNHSLSLPLSGLLGEFYQMAPAGNLVGPVLGGLLANPAAEYPSIFPQNSLWTSYPFLLPNLVVGILQALTFILTFLVLHETHPRMTGHSGPRPSVSCFPKGLRFWRGPVIDTAYAPLVNDDSAGLENARQEHPPVGVQNSADISETNSRVKQTSKRAFTPQVVLQIVAVSLLAFHKVGSDSLMSTFLALESSTNDNEINGPSPRIVSFLHSRGGFGLNTSIIGIIFLTESIFRAAIQPTVVPWLISKLGALSAVRWILGLYPVMYIFTSFLPNIPSPFQFALLLPDLCIKVALSSVGYICSAVL
ncbi:major facilitator superfamily domain-containing protein [Corynascus similis CBS 632.67]